MQHNLESRRPESWCNSWSERCKHAQGLEWEVDDFILVRRMSVCTWWCSVALADGLIQAYVFHLGLDKRTRPQRTNGKAVGCKTVRLEASSA